MSLQSYDALLAACHRPFKYWEHEFNPQGHIYIKIQSTVQRLNSLGVPWNLIQHPPVMGLNSQKTKTGKDQYDVICAVQLEIEGLGSRGASGGDTNFDPDNAVKSAGSYALRKAGSLFGISHYLMVNPKDNVALVNFLSNADLENITDLTKAVKLAAKIEGVEPTRDGINSKFKDANGQPYTLDSVESLYGFLYNTGRI